MSVAQRILLAEDLWDSVAADQEALKITQAQCDVLDERLQNHRAHPQENKSWEDVKQRLNTP